MGKLTISIAPALAPAEVLLVSSSLVFDGLHNDIKIFILVCLYQKLLKKRRLHSEHKPTIVKFDFTAALALSIR